MTKDKPIKIGSQPTYGESGMEEIDYSDDQLEEMSECYLVDHLNEKHKLDN